MPRGVLAPKPSAQPVPLPQGHAELKTPYADGALYNIRRRRSDIKRPDDTGLSGLPAWALFLRTAAFLFGGAPRVGITEFETDLVLHLRARATSPLRAPIDVQRAESHELLLAMDVKTVFINAALINSRPGQRALYALNSSMPAAVAERAHHGQLAIEKVTRYQGARRRTERHPDRGPHRRCQRHRLSGWRARGCEGHRLRVSAPHATGRHRLCKTHGLAWPKVCAELLLPGVRSAGQVPRGDALDRGSRARGV